jgi:hypothetical protein
MKKSPIAAMKETFGDKAKLVAAVEAFTKSDDLWVGRTNKDKGLAHVSNAKLLRLHKIFTGVKEKFGTRAKLIDAIVDLEKRTKDDGYKKHLSAFPVPRLWDLYGVASKRSKGAKPAAPKAEKAPKKAPAAKPAAAKAPAKKTAAKKA